MIVENVLEIIFKDINKNIHIKDNWFDFFTCLLYLLLFNHKFLFHIVFLCSNINFFVDSNGIVFNFNLFCNVKQIKFENESLNSVISTYNLDKCFNEKKANKWMSKALELVIMHNYTFDGLKFENGKVKHLKTQITKWVKQRF